jgi:peptidyl-prolyl cis-trans isomerase SurA
MKKLLFAILLLPIISSAQGVVLDKIAAIVGENIVTKSDIEQQTLYLTQQEGAAKSPNLPCRVLEDILFEKLLLNQAKIDSVEVDDKQIEADLNKRVDYYLSSPLFNGEVKKLEAYYGKPLSEIKDDFRKKIRDQMLAQKVQANITADIKVSPNDIVRFYNSIPKDSLPLINTEFEIGQIVRKPVVSQGEKDRVRNFLEDLRNEIKDNPALFAAKALINSEDQGSRVKGGELGYLNRDQLVPEFAAVAFNLKDKFCSEVVETDFGFHIIQLIDRRGESINVRHILISPKVLVEDLQKADKFLDSLYLELIKPGAMPFSKAAELYSDDADTKKNGGMILNPATNATRFDLQEINTIDNTLYYTLDKMNEGDISKPLSVKNRSGDVITGYRLVYLKTRTKPHVLSIKEDYQKLQMLTENDKKRKAISKWIDEKRSKTYIKIDNEYINCSFDNKWIN